MSFEPFNLLTSTSSLQKSPQRSDDEVISVSQLNKMAKSALENTLPIMWIKGEISGLKSYSHLYFDLKDEGAKISCVMFAKLAVMLDFPLENGMQVEVRGRVTIYPQNGSYQINVERARKVGLGALWEAYARLIEKLKAAGLFEAKYKKPIPIFPRTIGVITSKEGSVIRDVVTTLKRRMPNIPLIIYHSAVQGSDASMQLVRAIRTANQRQEVDVLIVCRGGGSMEDLWCFNEEVVAQEVFNSQIPIISAVGHETDTTIIDYVADLRAPTPTAAAELVAKSRQEWLEQVNKLKFQLSLSLEAMLNNSRQRLDLAIAHLKGASPQQQLKQQQDKLAQVEGKLRRAMVNHLANQKWQLDLYTSKLAPIRRRDVHIEKKQLVGLQERLQKVFNNQLQQRENYILHLSDKLALLNPQQILSRGYAIIRDNDGKALQRVKDTRHHARISITFADGDVAAIIDKHLLPEQGELI